ncbi:hypothetical protein DFH07DRAFT_950846 [Mycena maculata]|uniref:Uncharacterized protein n=1 Tax=Mycena maculata TaxID=230809 RepID=A0AAD7NXD9_9AGAR|nr:hypothetical protein DFH07DRAFT_950846 [Mycena maculata]
MSFGHDRKNNPSISYWRVLRCRSLEWAAAKLSLIYSNGCRVPILSRGAASSRASQTPSPPASYRYRITPAGYKPTYTDYATYVVAMSSLIPLVAMLLDGGGIIGRLAAKQAVGDDLSGLGPSNDVFDIGDRLWDGKGPTTYWNDTLTP